MANQIQKCQVGVIPFYVRDCVNGMGTKPTLATVGSNFKMYVAQFQDAALPVETWNTIIPDNFLASGDITLRLIWRANATTGNIVWGHYLSGLASGEATDPTPSYTDWDAVSTAGTANLLNITSKTIAAATHGLSAGDFANLAIRRNGNAGTDTLAVSAELLLAVMYYTKGI